jgi:hypothetical protein
MPKQAAIATTEMKEPGAEEPMIVDEVEPQLNPPSRLISVDQTV